MGVKSSEFLTLNYSQTKLDFTCQSLVLDKSFKNQIKLN